MPVVIQPVNQTSIQYRDDRRIPTEMSTSKLVSYSELSLSQNLISQTTGYLKVKFLSQVLISYNVTSVM